MIRQGGVTVAQVRVPDAANEVTQADVLLDALPVPEIDPSVFTEAIRKRPEWHYVMTVKGNQPTLQHVVFDAVLPLLREKPHDIMEDQSRGRRKIWSCWTVDTSGIDFPGAEQAAIIVCEVFEVSGDLVGKEIALVLTSADAGRPNSAALNRHNRSHWGIETKATISVTGIPRGQ
jgi:hypothetical protein